MIPKKIASFLIQVRGLIDFLVGIAEHFLKFGNALNFRLLKIKDVLTNPF